MPNNIHHIQQTGVSSPNTQADDLSLLGQIPNHIISHQEAVIGALFRAASDDRNDVIDSIFAQIEPKHFMNSPLIIIFKTIKSHYLTSGFIELMAIDSELEKNGESESTGGYAYLSDIVNNTSSYKNVQWYIDEVLKVRVKLEFDRAVEQLKDEAITPDEFQEVFDSYTRKKSGKKPLSFTRGSAGFDINVNYLVDNFLPSNKFGVVYGRSDSYKSFHVIDWGCCIATGKSWNGHETEQGLVVYIAGEGAQGARKRVKAWELSNNIEAENFITIGSAVMMNETDGVLQLISTLTDIEKECDHSVDLVIIDTLARCNSGEENSTTDMGLFIQGCDKVKEMFNTTVLAVHHSGKDDSKGARGSSSLYGANDFEYKVSKKDELKFELKCTKMKDSERPKPLDFELAEVVVGINKKGNEVRTLVRQSQGEPAKKKRDYFSGDSTKVKDANLIIEFLEKDCGRSIDKKLRDDLKSKLPKDLAKNTFSNRWRRAMDFLIEKEIIVAEQDGKVTFFAD